MGILTKNIPKVEQDLTNVPEGLQIRRKNAVKAGYNFAFDDKEKSYISYNKLRSERPDKEIVQVAKIRRLKDRDTGKEYMVYYQTSKTYDYEDNLVRCPHVEKIGVEDAPQTTKQKNSQNQITDIDLIETQNDFYMPFSKSKIKELFDKSRNSQNITCYVGYTKPVKETGSDYMTDKKRIKDQELFMNEDFEELIQLPNKKNVINTYSKVGSKKKMKSENKDQEQNQDQEEQNQQKKQQQQAQDDLANSDDGLMTQEEYDKTLEEKIKNNELPKIASTESIIQKPRGRFSGPSTSNDDKQKQKQQQEEQQQQQVQQQEQASSEVEQEDVAEVEQEENDNNGEEATNNNTNGKLKIGSLD